MTEICTFLLKDGGVVGGKLLGGDGDGGLGRGGAEEGETLGKFGGGGEERVIVVPAAQIGEWRGGEGERKFAVGGALETYAANLMVERMRIAHQYGVGTKEECAIEVVGEEAVDEYDVGRYVFGVDP